MKKALRAVAIAATVKWALLLAFVLYLGKPWTSEPAFLKRMRLKMWMWGEMLALIGYGLWHPHLLSPGATSEEKAMPLPGDDLVPRANLGRTYGITINGSPEDIWPWLVQMGEGRASWYCWSPAHVYPEFRHQVSPYTINPAWQDLRAGQVLLDGDAAGKCNENVGAWRVAVVEDCRAIVFYSARDFLQGVEFDAASTRPKGMYGVTSWTFYLKPIAERRTRLLIRVRAEVGPPLLVPIVLLIVGNYDRVWEHTILDGVKDRVENYDARRVA